MKIFIPGEDKPSFPWWRAYWTPPYWLYFPLQVSSESQLSTRLHLNFINWRRLITSEWFWEKSKKWEKNVSPTKPKKYLRLFVVSRMQWLFSITSLFFSSLFFLARLSLCCAVADDRSRSRSLRANLEKFKISSCEVIAVQTLFAFCVSNKQLPG